MRGNVIIPSGKKLTIDGIKVEFSNTRYGPSGSKSGITVQQRGRLALTNGATLTAVGCGGQQMWDGITVEGDPNSPSSSNQGIVYMLTGHPSIEYTQRGVVLGSTGWKFGDKTITDPINNVVNTVSNYAEAQTWLQQVSGTDAETQDFIQLYTMLIDAGLAGRDVYHLTAQDFASVSGQLPHTTATSEQVRALDHILNGRYHPLQAETSGGERSVSRPGGEEAKAPASALRVYPNPFNDFVRFEAPAGTTIVSLRITDIFGKSVHEWNDMAGEQALNWQAKPTTEGVFLYQCRLSNGETVRGKLLQLKSR